MYRNVINEAAYKYNTEKRKLEDRDTYGKAFLQVMNLWEVDEAGEKSLLLLNALQKLPPTLLGVANVRLYTTTRHCTKSQAVALRPGTRINITGH